MSVIIDVVGRENPRQPRESDRGGRRAAGGRRPGPGRGALGRIHRRARGGGTARQRSRPLRRQGRAPGGRGGERADLRRADRPCGHRPGEARRHPDRPRRHGQQRPARRQRHPGGEPGRGQGGGAEPGDAALSLHRRGLGADAAGADDEHHQRRRTRGQPYRHPGIHGHAGGRRQPERGGPRRRGDLPGAEEGPGQGRAEHRRRRRGRLRPEPALRDGST